MQKLQLDEQTCSSFSAKRENAHYKLKKKRGNTDIIDYIHIKNFNKDQFLNMYDRHNIVS